MKCEQGDAVSRLSSGRDAGSPQRRFPFARSSPSHLTSIHTRIHTHTTLLCPPAATPGSHVKKRHQGSLSERKLSLSLSSPLPPLSGNNITRGSQLDDRQRLDGHATAWRRRLAAAARARPRPPPPTAPRARPARSRRDCGRGSLLLSAPALRSGGNKSSISSYIGSSIRSSIGRADVLGRVGARRDRRRRSDGGRGVFLWLSQGLDREHRRRTKGLQDQGAGSQKAREETVGPGLVFRGRKLTVCRAAVLACFCRAVAAAAAVCLKRASVSPSLLLFHARHP